MENSESNMKKIFENRSRQNSVGAYNKKISKMDMEELMSYDWTNINSINFEMSDIKDEAVEVLADNHQKMNRHLVYLQLVNNKIGKLGLKAFGRYDWSNLKVLSLSYNPIGNIGIKYLTRSRLVNLRQLWLQSTKISDGALIHLVKNQWSQLQMLSISYNFITLEGVKRLSKAKFSSLELLQDVKFELLLMESPKIGYLVLSDNESPEQKINKQLYKQVYRQLCGFDKIDLLFS